MNRTMTKAALLFGAAALLVAGAALAGGAHCNEKDAEAKAAAAKQASAGAHCDGVKGANAADMAKACGFRAGQLVYSYAVPGAECGNCVNTIQTALMAQKGVACAHVDLATRTAYVLADKKLDKKTVAKCIQAAGFKNSFKGQGAKVQAEFAKAMTSAGDKGTLSCSRKEKDKV